MSKEHCEQYREAAVNSYNEYGNILNMSTKFTIGGGISLVISVVLSFGVHFGFLIISLLSLLSVVNGLYLFDQSKNIKLDHDLLMDKYFKCKREN